MFTVKFLYHFWGYFLPFFIAFRKRGMQMINGLQAVMECAEWRPGTGLSFAFSMSHEQAVWKMFSLFHSACGGKGSEGVCVRDWNKNPFCKKDWNGKPALRERHKKWRICYFSILIGTLIYFKALWFLLFSCLLSRFNLPVISTCFFLKKIKIMDAKETRLVSP